MSIMELKTMEDKKIFCEFRVVDTNNKEMWREFINVAHIVRFRAYWSEDAIDVAWTALLVDQRRHASWIVVAHSLKTVIDKLTEMGCLPKKTSFPRYVR